MIEDYYGWRGKIGLIYPAPGWVMEPEFYAMSPKGVITLTTRISLANVTVERLQDFSNQALNAVKVVAEAPVDVIILGCTSGSFVNGSQYNKKLVKQMKEMSGGIPCTTTASAIVAALNKLNIKNISVITPYINDINIRAKDFLETEGFKVTNIDGMGFLHDSEIDSQSTEKVFNFAKKHFNKEAEGMMILCTGLRTISIIEALEKEIGKPVITAVQASFWHCLQLAGINEKIKGYGMLLAE